MKHLFIAATAAAFLAAAPAMAAEEYQYGPARPLESRVPTADVGSVQTPHFDGQLALATPREQIVARQASEASVESLNSATQGLSRSTAVLLAQR